MNEEKGIKYLTGLKKFGMRLGLENVTELLDRMGNPQREWRSVHVAGTNGKGSVCAFVSSVLREAGYKVGLYTSPHLVRLNERIQINGVEISDRRLEELAESTGIIAEDMASVSAEKQVTFFEFLTALAFRHFCDCEVDFGILEVGLGGRLDATNVVVPEVSVITHLAVEHTKYLGNTIDEIAMEKAGIIKEGVPVVVADKPIPEAIVRTCRERSSELTAVGTDIQYERIDLGLDGQRFLVKGDSEFEIEIKLLGLHQLQNASTAFGVIEALRRSGYGIPDAAISRGFSRTFWPGRFQIAMRNPFLVLDAAHNADAALQLRRTVDETLQYKRSFLILGILDDKDLRSFAEALTPIADTLIAVEPNSPRAFSAKEIAREMEGYVEEVRVIPDVVSALRNALSNCGRNDLVCVSGSNTTVGEAMQYLKGAKQWER